MSSLMLVLLALVYTYTYAEVVTTEESDLPPAIAGYRNLVPFGPMLTIFNGPHGSYHYNPEQGKRMMKADEYKDVDKLEDHYVHPRTGCALNKLFEEWRKNHCPDIRSPEHPGMRIPYQKQACRISFGDIAHRAYENWDDHETHDDGTCIDIRPFHKDNFKPTPLAWHADGDRKKINPAYNQTVTVEFLRFIKKFGASNIFFNDPDVSDPKKTTYVKGVSHVTKHDDHMHFCLKPDKIPDQYCPELKDEPMTTPKQELPESGEAPLPTPNPRKGDTSSEKKINRGPR